MKFRKRSKNTWSLTVNRKFLNRVANVASLVYLGMLIQWATTF